MSNYTKLTSPTSSWLKLFSENTRQEPFLRIQFLTSPANWEFDWDESRVCGPGQATDWRSSHSFWCRGRGLISDVLTRIIVFTKLIFLIVVPAPPPWPGYNWLLIMSASPPFNNQPLLHNNLENNTLCSLVRSSLFSVFVDYLGVG